MSLVTVNSFDLTPFIIAPSYEMNQEDVFREWVDGNGITHRNVYRTRISGQFDVKFWDRSAYTTFLSSINGVKTGGYYPMTVYVNNTELSVNADLFMNFQPILTAKYSTPEYEKFRITVEER